MFERRRTTRNTNPAPSAAGSLSGQRPAASHRLPLPSDRVVTAEEKGDPGPSLPQFKPAGHQLLQWRVPRLPSWENRKRRARSANREVAASATPVASGRRVQARSHWLRRSTRNAAEAAPGLPSLAPSAHGRPSPSSPWLRDSQSLAPGLPLPAAGGAEVRPP